MMMTMMNIMMCRCCLIILLLCRLEIPGVSAWAPVRAPLPLQQSYYRNGNRNSNGITTAGTVSAELFVSQSPKRSTLLYSTTIEDTDTSIKTTTTPSVAPQQQSSTSSRRIISMPSIHYTVPGIKRGWKNLDTGVWMDVDGPRNGPPQNYWRQQSDEKLYKDSMSLVQDLLQLNNQNQYDLLIDGLVQPFEFENSIRRPFLNRLILGDWAPIVRNGEVIADNGKGSSSSSSTTATSITSMNYSNEINVPYCFHIQRTAGQKLAPKTHYGTFDQHLEAEEEITIQQQLVAVATDTTTTTSPSSSSSSSTIDGNTIVTTSSGVVKVSSENEHRLVKGLCSDNDDDLYMGGITYISKYMMIMRREQLPNSNAAGPVIEIWMRIDPDV